MGSKERRTREKLGTRQLILDAARDLFVEEGYEAVTMRKIADAIEYSATAIYVHFADKDALLRELCMGDFRSFTARFAAVPADVDPLRRLFGLGRAYLAFALEHPNQYRLLFMTPRVHFHEGEDKPEEDAYDILLATVQAAVDADKFDPGWNDPHRIAQLLWSTLHGIIALQMVMPSKGRVPKVPPPELAEVAMNVLMVGFRMPPPP